MKKLTRKERLDALHDGFYRCGHLKRENIEDYVLTELKDRLTDLFAESVRTNNTKLLIVKIRTIDFVDNEGCYYDFRGKTYQYGQFLIHIYSTGTASISLLAK